MRARLARMRVRVKAALDREAKVRDLMKASLPLWGFVVIGCGAGLCVLSLQAQQREDDLVDARYSGCVNGNVQQQGDRDSTLNTLLVAFGFTEAGAMTEADRTRIVAQLDIELQERYRAAEAQAALDNPFRDCSPEGIAEYLAHPPADPAELQPSTGG